MRTSSVWLIICLVVAWMSTGTALAQQQLGRPDGASSLLFPGSGDSYGDRSGSSSSSGAGGGMPPGGGVSRPTIINRSMTGVRDAAAEERLKQAQQPPPQPKVEQWNEFQDFVAASLGRRLPIFGHSLFDDAPSTFAPIDRVPVTADYVVGPGDEIVIRAWGQVDIDYSVIVDRNGTIHVPQIGTLTVGGLRYQDLHAYLRTAIGRVFRNFELSVHLGQLRSIQVFVVGQARRPGAYTVSSLTTLVNALFVSGGPSVKGSMRSIQLKRGDRVVSEFDVYDLLINGDKSKDARLIPGDVIYIPPVGDLVAVSGSVNQPAIYEVKSGSSLSELVRLAGGLSTVAKGQKVKVERIVDRRTRQVEEFELDTAGMAKQVRAGDVVSIEALSPRFDNAVTLRGAVANPGRYPWREGMRIRDLLPDREALIAPDYWRRVNRAARVPGTGEQRIIERAIERAIEQRAVEQRAPATPPAEVRLFERAIDQRTVDRNSDARGTGERGDESQMPDLRPGPLRDTRSPEARAADPLGMEQRAAEQRLIQQRLNEQWTAEQRGRADMKRLFDEINWDYAVIERLNPVDLTTMLIPFSLEGAVIRGDNSQNLLLRPGDVVTIFSRLDIQVPVAKQTKWVRLEGEVRTPGFYQIQPGETLRQLVTRIGGFSPSAYLYASEFTRESVRVQQQKRLDESIDRLSQEVERTASGRAQSAQDDKENVQVSAESQRRLIARLREMKASGRVVLEVPPDRTELKDLPEMILEDGDRFFVPARPSTVAVIGSVYNQTAFVFDRDKGVGDYLRMAGGFTRGADDGRTYVVRADGSVTGRAQSSFFKSSSGEKMNPGDTIVVPENLERFFLTKQLKDWTQIFYQFALGVAGLKVLRDF